MTGIKFTFVTLLLTFSVSVWPQNVQLAGKLDESYSTEVRTSGRILVGVWGGVPADRIKPSELRVLVPENLGGSLVCFRASTRDGVYAAKGVLKSPENVQGALQIEYYVRGTSIDNLLDYHSIDFAPAASLQGHCNSADETIYLPTLLPQFAKKLTLVLNSRGSVIVSVSIDGGLEQLGSEHCKTNNNKRSVAFDVICTLDADIGTETTNNHIVTLTRKPKQGPLRVEDYMIRW